MVATLKLLNMNLLSVLDYLINLKENYMTSVVLSQNLQEL